MKTFVGSLKYVPSGIRGSTHNLEIGAWRGKEKENTWEIELFVKMGTGILLCSWRFTKLQRLQLVILKVGGSSELLWRPGQRARAAGWHVCSSTVGCGKNDELSIGQTDVMKSSSFKGKPGTFLQRVVESMDLRIWMWWNMRAAPSGGSLCKNPIGRTFPRRVKTHLLVSAGPSNNPQIQATGESAHILRTPKTRSANHGAQILQGFPPFL